MEVTNCRTCGKLFNYMGSGRPICEACASALEEKFFEVREYIRDNKNAGINEVAEVNKVSVSQIKQWIREERLEFSEASVVTIECENCGAPIKTGRFCKACKGSLTNGLSGSIARPKPAETEKRNPGNNSKGQARFMDKL